MVDSSTIAATGFFDDWILCAWLQLFDTSAFLASGFPATGYAKHCRSLLIVDVTADFIITDPALALLFTTADCDDITADVNIADFRYRTSC
ncbi:ubiquitin-specific protease 17 [Dorcoceras hygrometricum]|uniref:Ubiquitin-specific protease 17 n=1 Tax=Dorcoceras hygrometricum TaxID=472368 RepID=A0A2Z7D6X3_9LAMI|nr:ubiquitin-specific protease 17 [Dorcoceras hygrometricum]